MLDQQMIKADLAELIDDHGGACERRVLEQAVEQRGLAGAEKPGEHRKRYRPGRGARPRCGRLVHCLVDAVSGFAAVAALGLGFAAVDFCSVFAAAFGSFFVPRSGAMIGLSAAEAGAKVPTLGDRIDGVRLNPPTDALVVAGFASPFGSAVGVAAVFGASLTSGLPASAVPRFFLARPSATSVGCAELGRNPTHTGIGTEACKGPSSGPAVARPRRLCSVPAKAELGSTLSLSACTVSESSSSLAGRRRCLPHISSRRFGGAAAIG